MGDAVDELGDLADGEVDIVGEEVVQIEAFIPVSGEVFVELVGAKDVLVQEKGVSAESIDAVLDGSGGAVQESGDGAEVLSGAKGLMEGGIGEGTFGVVIQLESSGTKGFSTGFTPVSGDRPYDLGVVGTDPYDGDGPVRLLPCGKRVIRTGRVGTEGWVEHRYLRSFLQRKLTSCLGFSIPYTRFDEVKRCFT